MNVKRIKMENTINHQGTVAGTYEGEIRQTEERLVTTKGAEIDRDQVIIRPKISGLRRIFDAVDLSVH